jgi:putative PIN family toxin of toxin-antitoxin system
MGTKAKKCLRVILDTNVLVSALLFRGELSVLVPMWKDGAFIPVFSKETFAEFKAVLAYPKFKLTKNEIDRIIQEEVLPYFDVVAVTQPIFGVCKDRYDDKFLSCAVSARADMLVSGDRALYQLKKFKSVKIVSPAAFLRETNKG